MPRTARQKSPSHIYHIITRGINKQDLFLNFEDRWKYLHILSDNARKFSYSLYAYCLMSNHVHLLINEQNASISEIMKCIDTSYAVYFNRKHERTGYVFQNRFLSEAVDSQYYLLAACRYIHQNPVKAHMVHSPSQYRWSSYTAYVSNNTRDSLLDKEFILRLFSSNNSQAVLQFIKFSEIPESDMFLEYEMAEEMVLPILRGMDEARRYVRNQLNALGISYELSILQPHSMRDTVWRELVQDLKAKSNLSTREIAEIVNLSKSAVSRV